MIVTENIWKEIRTLHNKGVSDREIARKVGCAHDTVAKYKIIEKWHGQDPRVTEEPITIVEEHHLKLENTRLKKQINDLLDTQMMRNEYVRFGEAMLKHPVKVPHWKPRNRGRGADIATPMTLASDWHLDEHVFEAQIGGCNAYNRHIAEIRVANYFDNVDRLCHGFIKGISYDGLYLLLGGDIFSGNIHEELKETNEGTIIESVLYWTPIVVSGIRYLADRFEHVHIPCVVGNHGRLTRKPVAKNRTQDNFDFLFYNMLAMQLKDDERVSWDISASPDVLFDVQGTRHCLTHGDQFRGGTGISGPMTPWALGDHRKRKKFQAIGTPYDVLVFGHWHTLTLGVNGMIVNGALKGYDEYAYVSNFPFEIPQQALWFAQPGHGVTGRWPVHVLGDNEHYDVKL